MSGDCADAPYDMLSDLYNQQKAQPIFARFTEDEMKAMVIHGDRTTTDGAKKTEKSTAFIVGDVNPIADTGNTWSVHLDALADFRSLLDRVRRLVCAALNDHTPLRLWLGVDPLSNRVVGVKLREPRRFRNEFYHNLEDGDEAAKKANDGFALDHFAQSLDALFTHYLRPSVMPTAFRYASLL